MDILGQSFNKFEYQSSSSSLLPNINEEEVSILLASARPKKPAGRRIFKETRHPVYRGVRMKKNNKWVCEVRVPNKSTRIWLGTYPTPEMAARAHDVAALTLKGKSACLNFADSVWRLPLPASTNADEIRRVAAEAANAFADEDKDSYDQKLSSLNAVTDYEVCNSHNSNSFGVGIMEDANKGNNKPLQQGLHVDVDEVAAGVSAFDDDTQHWVRSMADEPLRSPLPFAVRYDHREWNDVDVDVDVDAEVSLWNFTI